MPFDILVACTESGGIGKDGKIPWYLPPDLKWFQEITSDTEEPLKKNAVIMGRNTWNSLPKKPLKKRRNIVLTTCSLEDGYKDIITDGGEVFHSLDDALTHLQKDIHIERIFVIGGEKLYKTAINHPRCNYVFVTLIKNDYLCDTYFPIRNIQESKYKKFKEVYVYNENRFANITYSMRIYRKTN